MEGACDSPIRNHRQSSSFPFPCTTGADVARSDRSNAQATVQQTETRHVKRRRAQEALDIEISRPESLSLWPSTTERAGHGIATSAGREESEATERENLFFQQALIIAAERDASGSADLTTAAKPAVQPGADDESKRLLKCLTALLRQQEHAARVSSCKQLSRSPSPPGATAAVCAQHQPHWREHKEEQSQRWKEPQRQQHWWQEGFQHVHKHRGQECYLKQEQGQTHEKCLSQSPKQLQPTRERQEAQPKTAEREEYLTDTNGSTPQADRTIKSTGISDRRHANLSFRNFYTAMKGTRQEERRRGPPDAQRCDEEVIGREPRKHQQSDQKDEQKERHQQHSREQTSDELLLSYSVQGVADGTHLSSAEHEREERHQERVHHGGQREDIVEKQCLPQGHCVLREIDRLGTRQQHQAPQPCLRQHQDQAGRQQEQDLQAQQKQCNMQRVQPHEEPLSRARAYAKRGSAIRHAHAMGHNVLAAGTDLEKSKGAHTNVASPVQSDDVQHSDMKKQASLLLAKSPLVPAPQGNSPSSSSVRLRALTEKKALSVSASRVRPGICGASVIDPVSVSSCATVRGTTQKPEMAAPSTSACQNQPSGDAAAASPSATEVAPRESTTTASAARTGAGVAPRRKQLSGAQKRKRKRELMAKCRVEQASLLSFLATTVTSESILNDWYALESQLRDECAYFERLASSAWNSPGALSPHSLAANGSTSRAALLSSVDAEEYPIPIPESRKLPELCSPASVGCERLDPLALPDSQHLQDQFPSQLKQQTETMGSKQQLGQHQVKDLTLLNDEKASIGRTEPYSHSKRKRSEPDDFLHGGSATEAHGNLSRSWSSEEKDVLLIDAIDQASGNSHSSADVSCFDYSTANCSGALVVAHVESSTSGSSNNILEELNTSPEIVSSRSGGDVLTTWGCNALVPRCDGLASSNGKSELLLSGSTTPCSGSSNTTPWEWPTPISSQGTTTSRSCKTWTDEHEDLVENKDTASIPAPDPGARSEPLERGSSATRGPEIDQVSIFDTVESNLPLPASRGALPCMVLDADCSTSGGNVLKRGTTSSVHSNKISTSYDRLSSPSGEDASVEDKNIIGSEKTDCCNSMESMDSTACHSSINGGDHWKHCGISDSQQSSESPDVDSRPTVGGNVRLAESCRMMTLSSLVATHCSPGGRSGLECGLTGSQKDDGSKKETSDLTHSFVTCARISRITSSMSAHGGTAFAHSPACCIHDPLSAGAKGADPLNSDSASEDSSPRSSPYECPWPHYSDQQQLHGQLPAHTHFGPADAVKRQVFNDSKAIAQLPPNGNSRALEHCREEGGEVAEGIVHSTIAKSSAATMVDTAQMEEEITSSQRRAREDTASSTTSTGNTTDGAGTHKESSLSADSVCLPPAWLSSSTPLSPIAQSRRNTAHGLSSSESKPVARLLAVCKELTSFGVADDDTSTASSSPAPVLQQPPAPPLCLHPDCDCKTAVSLSPSSAFSGLRAIRAAGLPACVNPCPLSSEAHEQLEGLLLSQSHTKQQDKLMQLKQEPSHPKQQKTGSLTSETGHRYQLPAVSPEQQQTTTQGITTHAQQEARKDRLNCRKPIRYMPDKDGMSLTTVGQQQQQCAFSQEDEDSALSDPALWPTQISDALRVRLVRRGPVQVVDFDFPRDSTQRRFGRQHYWRTAATGERYWRSWLVYSKSRDAVYCFCCKLYSQLAKSVVSAGFRRWKGAAEVLRSHEQSKDHRTCMLQWKCMCVKVGAEVAFGDLVQLWLPNGPTSAPTSSLDGAFAHGSVSGATTSARVKATEVYSGETTPSRTTEARLRPHLLKRELWHHHATPQKFKTRDANEKYDVVGRERRSSSCQGATGDDVAEDGQKGQDILCAKGTETAEAGPVGTGAASSATGNDTHRAAALWRSLTTDCARGKSEYPLHIDAVWTKEITCEPIGRFDGLNNCSSPYTDLTPSVLKAYCARDVTRTRWLVSEGNTTAEKRGMAEA